MGLLYLCDCPDQETPVAEVFANSIREITPTIPGVHGSAMLRVVLNGNEVIVCAEITADQSVAKDYGWHENT